jgi:hypothetical protein
VDSLPFDSAYFDSEGTSRIDLFLVSPTYVSHTYSTLEWTIIAEAVHDNKYDYSNVIYRGARTDVEVICPEPEHGPFLVQPTKHIGKRMMGCPICKPRRRIIDTGVFIEDAKAIHGDKYDYSKVDYKNNSTMCEIICPEHGRFLRSYRTHIRNQKGCPICEAISKAEKRSTQLKLKGETSKKGKSKTLSPRYNPEYHGAPDTGSRTKEQRKAYREYELGVRFAKEDPDNTLTKCRKVAEIYTHNVLVEEMGGVSRSAAHSLDEMITLCNREGLLDPFTARILNTLQDWGNLGSHARHGHQGKYPNYERIKPALLLTEQLLGDWIEDFVPLEH